MSAGDPLERYRRQMLVPQIGRDGQEKLARARVGLVGCGALGCVICTHLVRAGVGLVRIVDRDCPDLENLHRQILFTEDDVARRVPKAEAAAAFLKKANSQVTVEPVVTTIDQGNLPGFADDLDLLVDGTDNFPTRFVINDYAVARGMPWVYGGVIRTSGMSMTIVPGEGPCLRCLVRDLPSPDHSPTAATAGVLNTVVAVIGSVEAGEAIKLVVDPAARNQGLLVVDVWDLTMDRLEVPRDAGCLCCGVAAARSLWTVSQTE
ncbi:MAG: HesA/MoeB/ThiF family protein [Actinomycetia bacterium]|nr:HesA/MoeB/ThiF family protein [Actinomycetes bacterium]